MTDKEKGELRRIKILEFIKSYIKKNGYSPSYEEIADGVGLKSKNSVYTHIKKMLDIGMLETDAEDSPRALRVPGYKFAWEVEE